MYDCRAVPLRDGASRVRVDATTEEDIARAVAEDANAAPLLTDEQPAAARTVRPADVAATRRRLSLSQAEFAAWFGISSGTLRNRKHGRRVPDGPARVLLRVIEPEPAVVRRAVG
jgi:putative transcriptional regulator